MKKIYFLFLFVFFTSSSIFSQVLLTEGFEGGTFPPTGWTRINAGAGNDWQSSTLATFTDGAYAAATGLGCMVYEYSTPSPANAWMITPGIAMTNGSNYVIKFSYRIRSASYLEKLKVTIGNAATVADQTTTLWDNNGGASLSNTVYATATINYAATGTGNFFVGFNCYSIADRWALLVDDISVELVNPCSGTPAVANTTASVPYLCTPGTSVISISNVPATTGITYQWESSPAGANTFTNVVGGTGATTSSYTSATISASTDFRCKVTCSNGGAFSNSSVSTVTLGGVPSNDLVCNAITLVLNAATVCANTTCATATGDPLFSNSPANNTVWYSYTPATTGVYNFVMTRPVGQTTGLLYGWLGIYTATGSCPTLTLTETTPTNLFFDLTTLASVTLVTPSLTAGTTYYFMIDGFSGASGAFCTQLITPPAAPACVTNIAPTNAATGVAAPIATLSWNTAATATAYDIYFDTLNPPIFIGTIAGTSTPITGLSFNKTYYWYVVPKNNGGPATGCVSNVTSFTTINPPPAPANNDCAAAISVGLYSGTINGTTISATASVGAPACTPTTGDDDDVWYQFTALQNGTGVITVTGGVGFDAVVAAYSGTCGTLALVGSCVDNTANGGVETLILPTLTAGQTYYLRIYSYSTTTGGTFTMTLAGTALPVSITSFKGERNGTNNLLSWTTTTEVNNAGFELQRSADGINFSKLAFVESKANNGNSSQALTYNFSDIKPLMGAGYYRLKQLDKDGKSTLSDIVLIKGLKPSKLELVSVYPNPVINTFTMGIAAVKAEKITFIVSDITGKVIISKIISVVAGDNLLPIDVANLANGTYTVKAVCADGCETAIKKFVKQ